MRNDVQLENRLKHHWPCGRPPFERIALLLQGGEASTRASSRPVFLSTGPPEFNRRRQRRRHCRQSA